MSDGDRSNFYGISSTESQRFYDLTKQSFAFLEERYGYRHVEDRFLDANDYDAARLRVTFVSEHMQVDVVWYVYAASIDVLLGERARPGESYDMRTPYVGVAGSPRVIDLYSLAEVLSR